MVAVRTRSRRARQKVSDGNPRSGADRGGRANKARPRRPRRETVAPLSALVGSRAVEEDLRLRQRVTSISAGVGAPRRMASERPRRSLSRRQAFGFFAIVWRRSKGQFAVFAHLRSYESLPRRRRSHDSEIPRRHCEREMPRSISPRRFRRKVQRRGYCITSVTRLADARGGRAIVYDDTSDPRRSRSASADKKLFYSAASNVGDTTRRGCDKRVKTKPKSLN